MGTPSPHSPLASDPRAPTQVPTPMQTIALPRLVTLGLACLLLFGHGPDAATAQDDRPAIPPPAARKVDFDRDIRPILAANCYSCHGPEKQKSDFRLDVKASALRGGIVGPAI